jgi:hypothetical protein
MRRLFGETARAALGVVALACTLSASGCNTGPPTSDVSGTVSYKGKKLGNGTIQFIGKETKDSSLIGADGTYHIYKAPRGSVKVVIETTPPVTGAGQKTPPGSKDAPPPNVLGGPEAAKGEYVAIPKKYAEENTTPLTYEVTPGKQEKNFELTD